MRSFARAIRGNMETVAAAVGGGVLLLCLGLLLYGAIMVAVGCGAEPPRRDPAGAICPVGRPCPAAPPRAYQPAVYYAPTPAGGTVGLVNAYRSQMGLPPLAEDATLAAAAARNNLAGGGHRVNPGCYQCSAPTGDPAAAVAMWRGSGTHNAYLLLRTATRAGADARNGSVTINLK